MWLKTTAYNQNYITFSYKQNTSLKATKMKKEGHRSRLIHERMFDGTDGSMNESSIYRQNT